jgi:hypothetical protein
MYKILIFFFEYCSILITLRNELANCSSRSSRGTRPIVKSLTGIDGEGLCHMMCYLWESQNVCRKALGRS